MKDRFKLDDNILSWVFLVITAVVIGFISFVCYWGERNILHLIAVTLILGAIAFMAYVIFNYGKEISDEL